MKPAKPELQQILDWSDEQWQFAAIDADGRAYLYSSKPSKTGVVWTSVPYARHTDSLPITFDSTAYESSFCERTRAFKEGEPVLIENAKHWCIAIYIRKEGNCHRVRWTPDRQAGFLCETVRSFDVNLMFKAVEE